MLINVSESEFKPLLDRDDMVAQIKQQLGPWIGMVHDLTSYGSNLIPRCYSSSDKGLRDVVVLGSLLRQAVAMLDGVDVLLTNGATLAAHLQMRALFEASVYIHWILAADSEKKAAYYYVHNLRRKRLWASRTQPGAPESAEFIDTMKNWGVELDKLAESAKDHISEIDRILSQPEFTSINDDFEARRKKSREPSWHAPLGKPSFASIARAIGQGAQYMVFYSAASEVMHTSRYDHHVTIGSGEVTFQPIRSTKGFETVLRFSAGAALSTFRRVLEEYRPGELAAFRRKYLEKWQKEFLNFPTLQYSVKTIHG